MNTRKNKRKSKYRPRRRRINRTKKLKGGGWVDNLSRVFRCVTAPATQCMLLLDKAENIPRSLEDLMACVNKGSQLLDYCNSIKIDDIPPQLKLTFQNYKSELDSLIRLVKDNRIIEEFKILWDTPNIKGNEPLFEKYSGIYKALASSLPLSNIASKDNIIIWTDWWRSKIEYLITDLTIILTQIIGIHVGLAPAPTATPAPAATPDADPAHAPADPARAPTVANFMTADKVKKQ